MMKTALGITTLALLATGCSTTRHCEREQAYQSAEIAEIVTSVDGISPPSSPSALRIPELTTEAQSFAVKEADPAEAGAMRVRCLDVPPSLPEQPAAGA
jgi:hypothetical protein